MDAVFHIIGTCSDNHSHLDLIDIILYGGTTTISFGIFVVKNKLIYIKEWLTKKK